MGFRRISCDVKRAAIRLYERELLDVEEIQDCCGLSRRTWYRILKLWRETGDVAISRNVGQQGRHRILDREDLGYLLELIRGNPDYFLDELLHLLKTNRFISVHYTTIFRELERLRMSHKKLKKIALERDELQRADFFARMAQYQPDELCFIDEMSRDARSIGRRYGRSQRNHHAPKKQPFIRGRRTSTCSCLTLDGISATTVVEGSMTRGLFLEFLEQKVVSSFMLSTIMNTTYNEQVPITTPYPGPNSVLVLDNARIHHGEGIAELCDSYSKFYFYLRVAMLIRTLDIRLEYLPPYSPDLNPIEEAFSKIKHFLRRHQDYYISETGDGILFDMHEVMDIISDDDAMGYYMHAGYF
jgi:transposase